MTYTKEIFYFYPQKYGYIPSTIDEVHLIGEFNEWGKRTQDLEKYKLIKDNTERWIGLFEVPSGHGFYKFLLNKNTYTPSITYLSYSTVETTKWSRDTIWYQIIIDRFFKGNKTLITPSIIPWEAPPDFFNNFGGDLNGIKEKISYLKEFFGNLNNVSFYLNPLHLSTASNHKYWPEDFEKIDPQFGTDKDFKLLIDTIHNEGGKIIIDLVYNHSGINHYAFLDILKNGNNSKYYNWYRGIPHLPKEKIEIPILENYVGEKPQNINIENDPRNEDFTPKKESFISVWDGKYKFPIANAIDFKASSTYEILNNQPFYKLTPLYNGQNYQCWAGFFEIPELNTKNPDLKKHLFDCAKKWIHLGVDGFRLDVPDILKGAHQFWKEFREEISQEAILNNKNPQDIYITGEIWTLNDISTSFLTPNDKGTPLRFDSLMNYPVREAIFNFFSGEILNHASDSVASYGEISVCELDKLLHTNIECLSFSTSKAQMNVFSSHDTRRIRSVMKDDRKLKAAITMQFTLIGAPTIYYGDEIGMYGEKDPLNRATMKWQTYENLKHHLEEHSIYNFYQNLIQLRKSNLCFSDSPMLTVFIDNENKVYAYSRYKDNNDCSIIVVAKDGLSAETKINVTGMPFSEIINWKDAISGKDYLNFNGNIIIQPTDMNESFAIALIPDLSNNL